ncbi:MAG: serine/threonine-protein kinase [Planctomycetes bacterium]|nr:serine/threonine-protein kinase [Planctomycetota bacterium]
MDRDPRLLSRAENVFADLLVLRPNADARDLEALGAVHPELAPELATLYRQWKLFDSARAQLVSARPESDRSPAAFASAGARIGRFELVRLLGRGGMGEVWEAQEVDLKRRVALKLLPSGAVPSAEDVARFRREAEATSRVRHPGIVAVHSAGEGEGRFYIAYELVEGGRSLRPWLDERARLDELPETHYRETAVLFADVAEALEAAHQAGIVHRDLKPQNVLMTPDGRPKVADFGLAKVSGELSLSHSGSFLGTWFYASPEQVRGEPLDARSDVFSLGVTLYECLALRRPFDGDTREQVAARILGSEPTDPRTLRSRCPRDLAVIAAKALEKSRERRYPSMRALADDLRRHLAHQPISAREPSALERSGKWTRRHPTLATAIAVSSLAFVVVVGLLITTDRARRDAERARTAELATNRSLLLANADLDSARKESDRNATDARERAEEVRAENVVREQVITFLAGIFEAADPEVSADEDPPASKLLATAAESLRDERKLDPRVRAQLLTTLGTVYEKLGRYDEARGLLFEAVDLWGGPDGDPTRDAEHARFSLAATCTRLGEYDLARMLFEDLVTRSLADPDVSCTDMVDRLSALAGIESETGRFAEAEATLALAQDYADVAPDFDERDTLTIVETRAAVYLSTARFDEAERDLLTVSGIYERSLGPNNPRTVSPLNSLALVYRDTGRLAQSEALFEDCVQRIERSLEPDHPNFLVVRANLASLWTKTGRAEEARELLVRAIDLRTARVGTADPLRLFLLNNLGLAYFELKRFEEAEPLEREVLAGRDALFGSDHPSTQESRNNLAFALYSQGKFAEALRVQEETVARTPADAYQRAGRERLLESIRQALVPSGGH